MYRYRNITKTDDLINNDSSIIFAIVTNNINKVKELINNKNFNNVLDKETGFTALQYAIASPNVNKEIIKYLLNIGSDPKKIIGNQNIDSFDLAIRYNKKYLFEYFNNIKDDKINNLNEEVNKLIDRIDNIKETNDFLNKSITSYNVKVEKLNNEITALNKENTSLKRKYHDSDLALNNEITTLKKENYDLKKENYDLKKENYDLKKENYDLKKENNEYQLGFNNLLKKTKK